MIGNQYFLLIVKNKKSFRILLTLVILIEVFLIQVFSASLIKYFSRKYYQFSNIKSKFSYF